MMTSSEWLREVQPSGERARETARSADAAARSAGFAFPHSSTARTGRGPTLSGQSSGNAGRSHWPEGEGRPGRREDEGRSRGRRDSTVVEADCAWLGTVASRDAAGGRCNSRGLDRSARGLWKLPRSWKPSVSGRASTWKPLRVPHSAHSPHRTRSNSVRTEFEEQRRPRRREDEWRGLAWEGGAALPGAPVRWRRRIREPSQSLEFAVAGSGRECSETNSRRS